MVATILNEFFGIYEVIFGGKQGDIAVFVPRIVRFTEKKAGTVEMDIGKVEFHGAAFGDLEPLQYPPTSPMRGEFKDLGVSALLKGLATNNRGLCIVTTRYSIKDLRAFWQSTAPENELPRLSTEAGKDLLKKLGVRKESGTEEDFEKLVEDVKGHALTLNLLGTFLRDAYEGDIRKRDLVKFEEADAEEQGGHAFRVMDA